MFCFGTDTATIEEWRREERGERGEREEGRRERYASQPQMTPPPHLCSPYQGSGKPHLCQRSLAQHWAEPHHLPMALPWQQHPAGDCVPAPAAGRTGQPSWRPRQIPLVTPRVGAPVGGTGEEAPAGRRRRGWREGPPSSPRSHYSLQYETPGELSIHV